jgi:hypothetical protein
MSHEPLLTEDLYGNDSFEQKGNFSDHGGFGGTYANGWYMAVGMATDNLVIKEAILAVVSYNNKLPNFGPMHWRKLEAEVLALMVLEPIFWKIMKLKLLWWI